jgi:hypothetical protein
VGVDPDLTVHTVAKPVDGAAGRPVDTAVDTALDIARRAVPRAVAKPVSRATASR